MLLVSTLVLSALLVLPTQSANAAPVEACTPQTTPRSDLALCLSYELSATKAGTTTATQNTQEPVDVTMTWENTSTNHKDEAGQPRWLNRITANLLGSADSPGLITPGALLPDGLLLAGSSAPCAPGNGNAFTACTAGQGTGYAVVPDNPIGCAVCVMTFGIQRIENERDDLGTQVSKLKVTLDVCVNKLTVLGLPNWDCTAKGLVQTIPLGQMGQPLPFTLTTPTLSIASRTGITTAAVKLLGRSDQLAAGGSAPRSFVTARIPMKCGPSNADGTARAVSGATVTVVRSIEVLQCAQLTVSQPASRLLYGNRTSVTGTLRAYDRSVGGDMVNHPITFEPVTLRACPHTAVVPCSATPRTVRTDEFGRFSFLLGPVANTRYFVAYAGFHDDPIHLPGSYVSRKVLVAPRISRTPNRTTVPSGQTVQLTGRVAPKHAGRAVSLQRFVGGTWKTVARATLTSTSTYTRTVRLTGARRSTTRLRVVLPGHTDHLQGVSPSVTITFS